MPEGDSSPTPRKRVGHYRPATVGQFSVPSNTISQKPLAAVICKALECPHAAAPEPLADPTPPIRVRVEDGQVTWSAADGSRNSCSVHPQCPCLVVPLMGILYSGSPDVCRD